MYFPYLTVRRAETEALINTVCAFDENKTIPILVPYSEDESAVYTYTGLKKLVGALIASERRFIILINNENDLDYLRSQFPTLDNYCIHGYESDNNNVNLVSSTVNIAIIHRNRNRIVTDKPNFLYHIFMPLVLRFNSYMNQYPLNKQVKIEDGFQRHEPNSTYPSVEIFNSELCFTYDSLGIAGFGDFTILEAGYIPSGSADANKITHVIHLTQKPDDNNNLFVYHYLTTCLAEPDNRSRSYKTIEKAYLDRTRHLHTKGVEIIEEKYTCHTSTNLEMYKRIGITHHIELINSLI